MIDIVVALLLGVAIGAVIVQVTHEWQRSHTSSGTWHPVKIPGLVLYATADPFSYGYADEYSKARGGKPVVVPLFPRLVQNRKSPWRLDAEEPTLSNTESKGNGP